VLVAAHGNSIRGLLQAIDGVPAADIGKVATPACP
jgi:bisphosphoglycerate-dependent phosphoglycerate mutase